MNVESVILENLVNLDEFTRTVIPYVEPEYFPLEHHRILFNLIKQYVEKYNSPPAKDALLVELETLSDISSDNHSIIQTEIESWKSEDIDATWLIDTTEKWCQDRALFNALSDSVMAAQNSENANGISRGEIPEILSKALGVSFDTSIGLRYIADPETRYELYHRKTRKYPISINKLNFYTDGGVEEKTLNIIMGTTNAGKSIWLYQFAADYLLQGKNVLCITMEMSEMKVLERVDANLLDVSINQVRHLSKDRFMTLAGKVAEKTQGELVVREYPTGQAHTGHFRHLLNELKMKQEFEPDVIIVDYINICASSRIKKGGSSSYEYVKAISEELRGLAVEFDLPIWTATQSNRGAATSSEVGIDDVSESWGLPQTADFLCVIITDDEMKKTGQIMVKILKNRFGPVNNSFMANIDYDKMRVFNQADSQQSQENTQDHVAPIGTAQSETQTNRFSGFNFND